MKLLLVLVILLMGGAGYYEYQNLQKDLMSDQKQISDLQTKLHDTATDTQKAEADLLKNKQFLADAEAKSDALAKQLQAAQASLAAQQASATASSPGGSRASSASTATATPAVTTTKLGTINALDGKVYSGCQLLKITADHIVVSDADGITEVTLNVLPMTLQKQFGFDPKQGSLAATQVQTLEQERQSLMAAGK